jgi:5-(carboxyamino)imidazole ribonucleotide mutase
MTVQVGIVMGSDSDWPVMRAAAEACREFDVEVEADVVSAHRMPHEMLAYGEQAAERGHTCRACSPRSPRCRSSACRCP